MGRRLDLHKMLTKALGSDHVYYQPPATVKMVYPCIVYGRSDEYARHADNIKYLKATGYQVTVIDRNPDSDIPDRVGELPLSRRSSHFAADGLHHDVFTIYVS